ncbi:MAG: polyhydroxyalkanoate synthesis repressor PhaR [Ferrovum sp.]|jgi:polyhydroxyalkanoate synthesis repressor PhaR|nr:polyhydroxyalkanoate synthesis repressor PhaR [Ferrovum sp.]
MDILTVRIIKKYPNRRLYDTITSAYITLLELRQLVLQEIPVQVLDVKTQQDITRQLLAQIILEAECGGHHLLSNEMLAQMIRAHGNALHGVMCQCLEQGMQRFLGIQKTMKLQASDSCCQSETKLTATHELGFTQNMIGQYLAQSTALLMEWQNQLLQSQLSETKPHD